MNRSKTVSLYLLLFSCMTGTIIKSRDVLLEFKAAYFLPTDSLVRDIYGNGGALYGPEVTFRLGQCQNWYGFASIDFLSKKGHSIGLCDPTKMYIMPIGVGLKYFVPFNYGDFYIGLGFQPAHLKTINCSPFVVQKTSKWGFGGIAKIGAFFNLPHNFFIDLFFDYSFVKVPTSCCSGITAPSKADISGSVFGAGVGYRFN